MKFTRTFHMLRPIYTKSSSANIHNSLLRQFKFRENQRQASHALISVLSSSPPPPQVENFNQKPRNWRPILIISFNPRLWQKKQSGLLSRARIPSQQVGTNQPAVANVKLLKTRNVYFVDFCGELKQHVGIWGEWTAATLNKVSAIWS